MACNNSRKMWKMVYITCLFSGFKDKTNSFYNYR